MPTGDATVSTSEPAAGKAGGRGRTAPYLKGPGDGAERVGGLQEQEKVVLAVEGDVLARREGPGGGQQHSEEARGRHVDLWQLRFLTACGRTEARGGRWPELEHTQTGTNKQA